MFFYEKATFIHLKCSLGSLLNSGYNIRWSCFSVSQILCKLPLSKAVLQSVPGHGRSRRDGEKLSAEETCPSCHECHQHSCGEPSWPREGFVCAGTSGKSTCSQIQSGANVLQSKKDKI